jgi:hypothetical protein
VLGSEDQKLSTEETNNQVAVKQTRTENPFLVITKIELNK